MISDYLILASIGLYELSIILIIFGLPILSAIFFFSRKSKHRQNLHKQMDKLTNELEQARKQAQAKKADPDQNQTWPPQKQQACIIPPHSI